MTRITAPGSVKGEADRAESVHVGPELTSVPRAAACPACGAALRFDAQWCSLCYHDLRPAPEVLPEAIEAGLDPLTAPLLDLVLPAVPVQRDAAAPAEHVAAPSAAASKGWPCLRCGVVNAMDATMCGTCGMGFLASAHEKPSLVIPGLGDLHAMSRGQRASLAGIVVTLFLLPVMLITFLTTGAPHKAHTQDQTPTVVTTNP